jgi:hypothetical protein
MKYISNMDGKKKRIKKSNSKFSSGTEKEQIEIVPIRERIQRSTSSSSTIKNLETKPLKGPNALTMTQSLTNNDNIQKGNRKKLGDGSFIAAEDR